MIRLNTEPRVSRIVLPGVKTDTNVRYPLISPFSYAHIFWSFKDNELLYEIEEPLISDSDKQTLEKVKIAIREVANFSIGTTDSQEYIWNLMERSLSDLAISLTSSLKERFFYYIYRDFIGLDEIEPLMKDPFIEDIQCNGIHQPVFIVHRIFRNIKTNLTFSDMNRLTNFVEKLAQKSGRYISYATPILDGSLPDGSRVNATYTKDISSRGPTFTIRKFTKVPWTPLNLIQMGSACPEMLAYFWILVQYKLNLLVAGGTGSGKTTLLNAIAFFIPPEVRVVSIEDTRELNIPRENWLPSVVRGGITSGVGEVTMFSLLKASFRQIPDYVIVGEVRGEEASVLFQGMASGHSSMGTIHADSLEAVIRRLETPPIELSPSLINELDAIAIMTHARVGNTEVRKLREVVEVVNVNPDGTSQSNTPLIWDPAKNKFYFKNNFEAFKKIEKRNGIPVDKLVLEWTTRTKLLNELSKRNIVGVPEVRTILFDYLRNPTEVLSRFGISTE